MSNLTARDLRDAAFYLHSQARGLKECESDRDGNWADGEGKYGLGKERMAQLREEYEYQMDLARRLYRAARKIPAAERDLPLAMFIGAGAATPS